jgi:hypothetical protein
MKTLLGTVRSHRPRCLARVSYRSAQDLDAHDDASSMLALAAVGSIGSTIGGLNRVRFKVVL